MKAQRKALAVKSVLFLCGLILVLGPNVRAQTEESTKTWAAPSIRGVSTESPAAEWWNSFHDEELTRLIHRAVADNLDLRLAAARIDEARAARGVAKSAFYPSVGATTSAERLREWVPAFNPGTNTAAFHPVELNNFQVGFDSAWEIDVFGRIRNEVKAASANVRSAEENRRDVLVVLLGEVARSYADLRGFQLRLEIAEKNIQTQEDTVHLTQARAAAGLATQLDVSRAVAELETTKAVVPSLRSAISASIHRISVLVGQEPGALQSELEASAPVPVVPPEVPIGLPSDLLKRRPDVRRADDEIAAAAANVKAAKADYFPKFTLFGSAGRQATQLHDLSLSLGNFFAVGPAISLPIFTGGRIRSNIAVQNARWKQSQILYQSTVLNSLEETENALVNYSEEQERHDRLQAAVSQSQTALELSRELYTSGLGDFLAVLDAQRQLYGNEDLLAQSQTVVTTNLIALYKTLGGGWESFPQQ
ncbi:MAG TPA: efflux transporter outer membrane subunit [Terriglobales bacterium]|nr:efflux transporter outer membrane subunit [Terriglobales bacterium]